METTLTTCPQCTVYNEQLNNKADEIKILEEHVLKLAHKLQDESRTKEEMQERLNDKLMRLNDYAIRIRDMKIIELNDTILEKERHIIELQEMCREQGELVQAKAKAFHIIQQKLQDLDTRTTREDSTETEAAYVFEPGFIPLSSLQQPQKEQRQQRDSFSPGHAVVQFKMGSSGSPPPVDPSEECSSITQSTSNIQDDHNGDSGGNTFSLQKKKQRKKVTFDLPPRREFKSGSGQEEDDNITQAIVDVTAENDQLRQTIQEMEKCATESQNHLSQLQTQLDEMRRDGRNQILKARAAMQGRIRDLEDKIATMNTEYTDKIEHLNANIETLRADREWTLEENTRLLKLLSSNKYPFKEKLNDAWEALDAKQKETMKLRSKLDDDRALIVQLADDLEEAQQTADILLEQKISVLDDVERLKEALEAQDQYIELLEKDTMIYEEHVGLLRDSLGASKAERRALIKSKAYETKLKALEQEKEQMNRRCNGIMLHIEK
ncbi:hypothetical protein X798_01649 [Onchocerca flexuosa]|uniref:Uncharacterized protein n=1 Tax=Onchocerca flexuosa TaxID=387005 RepID=A0A238C1B0_9BILA|nr:hypothetical protein X798_01649 [Onchocerca flexuosa]